MSAIPRSLRARLLILVFFAALPAFGIIVYSALENRAAGLRQAEASAARLARHAAAQHGQLIAFTRQLLTGLANDPDVRDIARPGRCNKRLAQLLPLYPAYLQIGVIRMDGEVVCSALSLGRSFNLADRGYFRKALETRAFAVGEFQVGRITRKSSLPVAAPIVDSHGMPVAVVYVAIDVSWLGRELEETLLPALGTLSILDGEGTVLARYPGQGESVGEKLPELAAFLDAIRRGETRGIEATGADGIRRIYVTAPLAGAPEGSAFARVGIATEPVVAEANRILARNLLALGAAVLLVFGAAWVAADMLILRQARRLMGAVENLGAGDMSVRSGLPHTGDELGRLAAQFDHMAERLQRITRAQRTLSAGNRTLLRTGDETALLAEMCRVAVDVGGYRAAWVGYAQNDADKSVRVMASAGDTEGMLERVPVSWDDNEYGRGPAGTAIRSGTVQVVRDLGTDPRFVPWRFLAQAHGLVSVCALPLVVGGAVIGALVLYAMEQDAFDDAELELLDEMAADLAFGIQVARERVAHARAQEHIRQMAYVDGLTGLASRAHLVECLAAHIAEAGREGRPAALLMVDIEHFARIQNAVGYREGDRLLQQVAERLRRIAAERWVLARTSGDRFALLLPGADANEASSVAKSLAGLFDLPFSVADIWAEVRANIGIVLYPGHGGDPETLIRRADIAARDAQASGQGIAVFRGEDERDRPERLGLIVELRRAIENGELFLHYQPKVAAADGRVTGAEALVRWRHPQRGVVPPTTFIELAEQTGLIKPLTYWVLGEALRQGHVWREAGTALRLAVNLSTRNLRDPLLPEKLEGMLATWGGQLDVLEVEITESVLMEDERGAEQVLGRLRALGVTIAIDDFGTGYSSLRYLARLPVNSVKVDRSFVIDIAHKPEMRTLVAATIDLAHNLGLKVVAEGVDHPDQLAVLRELGCDEIQGYLFSRPLAAEDFLLWARSRSGNR
ncbi:MAG: bifunctional diguanylate cyclase/phosphodiesterase [Pseudomonadota bacterium]